jgi:hypothetical protein
MQKAVNPIVIKIAVCLLAIKEFWLLLGIPSFADAVVSFLTVGAVPGTQTTLSPEQVYTLLAVIFLLVLVLVFRKDVSGLFVRSKDSRAPHGKPIAMPIAHPHEVVVVRGQVIAPRKLVTPSKWRWRLRAIGRAVKMSTVGVAILCMSSIARISRRTWTITVHTFRWLAELAVIYWRMLEPYIRRFDSWLEKKLHQYDKTSTALSIGGEMSRSLQKLAKNTKLAAKEVSQPLKATQK